MKQVFTLLYLLLITTLLYSQVYEGRDAEKYIKGSQMVRFSDNQDFPSYIRYSENSQPEFTNLYEWLSITFGFDDNSGVVLKSKETDDLGFEHYRYQQTYNNIPIREAIFLVHVHYGKIISFNGTIFSNPSIQNNFYLPEDQALNKALSFVNASEYMWQRSDDEAWIKEYTGKANATYFPKGEKEIIYNAKEKSFRYAYSFDIYAAKPLSRQDVFVDAETGKILKSLNTLHSGNANGTAVTKYSGTKPITTDSVSPTQFRLRETGRGDGIRTYNMQQGSSYTAAVDFTDADNYWNNVNAQIDEAATDAHWGAEMTYDYYFIKHGRNSIDDNGFALYSYIHYNVNYSNAFWDGQRMTYGDGSSGNPYCALDVCAHEITHGLDSYTADLDYADESGAMNEGFSDIFGTAIEFYAKPAQANWTCGENIGYVIRNLANPNASGDPDTYMGTNWDPGGEVHQNSTVLSHWYYLVCQGGSGSNDIGSTYSVSGIGMTKASNIAYRMLTVYLTSTSNYADARFYAIVAASDLYGGCSPEVAAVTNAMYAVGIGAAYVPSVTVNFTANNYRGCSVPATVQFINQTTNATNYLWDFGDGTTSTQSNPTHTYTNYGNYNVQLTGSSTGCGTDSLTKNAFVSFNTTNSNYAVMPANGTASPLTCCTGTLFDSGENGNYANNTNGTITIAPPGASKVILTFTSFGFESGYDYLYVYNGPSTASPLIGQYDGSNLPNGGIIIATSGSVTLRQTTDQGLTDTGFELSWQCSQPASPPVSNFFADKTSTCTGVVQFNDATVNGVSSWWWDFGDGSTSTLQNPVHAYQANGVYTVTLKVTNPYGADSLVKTSYITVNNMPVIPVTLSDTACYGNILSLSASGSGQLEWYDAPIGGTLLSTGPVFTTPVLFNTTTYFVEDKMLTPTLYGGKPNNSGSGGYFGSSSNVHYQIFNSYTPLKLISVKVYAGSPGNRTILLRDSSQNVLQAITVNIPSGESRVTLNFDIPAAYSLQLVGAGNPDLYRNNNGSATYPYTLPGLLSITESSASKPPFSSFGNYYYFYDWEVKEPECISPRVPVTAFIKMCTGVDENDEISRVEIYPNPATDEVFVTFNAKLPGNFTIALYDVIGKKVFSETCTSAIGPNRQKISLTNLKPGIYFISLVGSSITHTEKVVVR